MRFLSCGVGQMRSNISVEFDRIYGSDCEFSDPLYDPLCNVNYRIAWEFGLILLSIISLILAINSNNAYSFIVIYFPNITCMIPVRMGFILYKMPALLLLA